MGWEEFFIPSEGRFALLWAFYRGRFFFVHFLIPGLHPGLPICRRDAASSYLHSFPFRPKGDFILSQHSTADGVLGLSLFPGLIHDSYRDPGY